MNNKMNVPLSGIIPPLVTPLLDDEVLDVAYMLFLCWELPVNRKVSVIN